VVGNCRLFVDTCSIMHEKAQDFFYKLAPILIDHKKQIIIPHKVAIEIERLQNSPRPATNNAAKTGTTILKHYIDYNIVDVRGEKNDPFADNVFHYVFSKFRTQYDLALLTQDKGLAMDILSLKSSQAIKSSKKLLVLKIGKRGDALMWRNEKTVHETKEKHSESNKTFRICDKHRPQKDSIINARKIPEEGDFIEAGDFGKARLLRVLGEGGEGKIFSTDLGHACKIYFKERLTENRFEKLALMAEKKTEIPGVCWPLALVRNSYNDFVGYLMPTAEGRPMQKCMFVKPLLEKYFPNWTRKNLVQLSITWLEKVIELHRFNIFIGDLNPLNFIIKSDQELFFVDTDSYQIEDFPCPVGMGNFTAPEIQGKDFASFLRTSEHEYFAIATLLFMVLLPGKPPYSHQGGGDPIKNIKRGQFPYPLGSQSGGKTPDGPWRYIWSHLPYKTKKAFHNCFVNEKRISPDRWLDLMKSYKFALEKGRLDPEGDGESDKLFPTRFKSVTNYAKEMYGAEDGRWKSFKCDNCGKTFQSNADQANKMKNVSRQICRDCSQIQKIENTTGEMIICSDCGDTFLFSKSEKTFYDQKGFDPPKRCKQCRNSRIESKSATLPSASMGFAKNKPIKQSNVSSGFVATQSPGTSKSPKTKKTNSTYSKDLMKILKVVYAILCVCWKIFKSILLFSIKLFKLIFSPK
jgi:DNA-directed RNA polymerase subunit RPC12/RpoP